MKQLKDVIQGIYSLTSNQSVETYFESLVEQGVDFSEIAKNSVARREELLQNVAAGIVRDYFTHVGAYMNLNLFKAEINKYVCSQDSYILRDKVLKLLAMCKMEGAKFDVFIEDKVVFVKETSTVSEQKTISLICIRIIPA